MAGFHWSDYLVFTISLMISLAIGVYYAVSSRKSSTTEGYLMGNRQMHMIPVTLSLTVSVISALTVQGVPVEIYLFGIPFILYAVGVFISATICAFTFIPMFHQLNITSVNEYLELRYNSRSVRLLGCFLLILIQSSYVGCLMFGPAIAMQIATGLNPLYGLLLINTTGTLYTTIGGIKAVVYTDVFQCFIMISGIILVLIMGTIEADGVNSVIEINQEWGRIFLSFSPHPHTRVTVWTTLIGNCVTYLGMWSVNQACTQRFLTIPNVKDSQKSILIGGVLFAIFHSLSCIVGLVLFGYYMKMGCDPIKSGQIENLNQLLPQFVVTALNHPMIPGFFISCLVSSSLSSLSSSVNSMSAIMWEDLLKKRFQHLTDLRKTMITKLLALGFGVLCTSVSFIVWEIGGNLSQVSLMLVGGLIGPLLGVHILGAAIPWSNWKGALAGGGTSIIIALWMLIGQILNKQANNPLPTTTEHCDWSGNHTTYLETTTSIIYKSTPMAYLEDDSKEFQGSIAQWIYTISFHWYALISVVITLIVGTAVSFITGKTNPDDVDSRFYFHCLRSKYGNRTMMHITISSNKEMETFNKT